MRQQQQRRTCLFIMKIMLGQSCSFQLQYKHLNIGIANGNDYPGFDNILNWLRLQLAAILFLLLMMSSFFHHQHCSSDAAVAVWDFVWTVFYTFFTLNSPREHEKSIWANEFLTIVSFSVAMAEGSSRSNITIAAAAFQRLVYTTRIIIRPFFSTPQVDLCSEEIASLQNI